MDQKGRCISWSRNGRRLQRMQKVVFWDSLTRRYITRHRLRCGILMYTRTRARLRVRSTKRKKSKGFRKNFIVKYQYAVRKLSSNPKREMKSLADLERRELSKRR